MPQENSFSVYRISDVYKMCEIIKISQKIKKILEKENITKTEKSER